jgi:hypothetical protein
MPQAFSAFTPEWWREGVLKEFEPAQYYSAPRGLQFAQGSPRQRRYFEESYPDITAAYYGAAGTAMRQNQAPMTFDEFLATDPWTARYATLPQANRGMTGIAANPRTRFLFNY